MKTYTVTLTDAEEKALNASIVSPAEWVEGVVKMQCKNAMDEIVSSEIEKKLALGETISGSKEDIVMAANIETAAEKRERFEREFAERIAQAAAQQAPQE